MRPAHRIIAKSKLVQGVAAIEIPSVKEIRSSHELFDSFKIRFPIRFPLCADA